MSTKHRLGNKIIVIIIIDGRTEKTQTQVNKTHEHTRRRCGLRIYRSDNTTKRDTYTCVQTHNKRLRFVILQCVRIHGLCKCGKNNTKTLRNKSRKKPPYNNYSSIMAVCKCFDGFMYSNVVFSLFVCLCNFLRVFFYSFVSIFVAVVAAAAAGSLQAIHTCVCHHNAIMKLTH